ncbi:NgoFVII family restriction endonuclease [Pyxidicoccus fallax]|uniref:NgoFVII family restriction endonuclease n=1 Tax=Pyxidicoccus fallax TaxID=394095 RepID=A0A848LI87_9BACT|nr:restriction endonuclease PLD domain-containing protein [Pyxidicoccus fallax]NMO17428.1 NgoFVII family restriction endonuclease [Pyxidicoccus fallax]NPC77977.1 NgoFVII family restriction endonuclease [Pyxidicoccus fallax]
MAQMDGGNPVVRLKVLRNTPLRPLAKRMAWLVGQCEEFHLATAFVSKNAVEDMLSAATEHLPSICFLTGTFGNNTRQATFRRLLELQNQKRLKGRIWRCKAHGDFHEKLYLWRLPDGQGVAWVGSANFTDGGLQAEGELIVEIRGPWDGTDLSVLRRAFEAEWERGKSLSKNFVDTYKESERPVLDLHGTRKVRSGGNVVASAGKERFFVTTVEREADAETVERVGRLLDGSADEWLRHRVASLSNLKRGHRGLVVDNVERKVALVEVTDSAKDGSAFVFAYAPLFQRNAWHPWNSEVRRTLAVSGLGSERKRPRSRWLPETTGLRIAKALYPNRTRDW